MPDIVDWLKKLGMSEYAQRFAENKIDVSVLRHLTDQDLKDIGLPLGHRRKMFAAARNKRTPTYLLPDRALKKNGVRLTRCKREPDRQAVGIDYRMNLAGQPPATGPWIVSC